MKRKLGTIVGATAALVAAPVAAQAALSAETSPIPLASNYAELLEPIPNAVNRLKLADAEAANNGAALEKVQFNVQLGIPHHHHHHHHSHDWYLRHGYVWYGGRWVTRAFYAHHHHHHHHHHNGVYLNLP